jgi:uncharacterized membrane protein
MHFDPELISPGMRWGAMVVALILGLAAAYFAPWRMLRVSLRQHLVFGTTLVLSATWLLSIDLPVGISLHPVLMVTAALLLGASLATLVGFLALVITTFLTGGEWSNYGVDALCTVAAPVLSAYISFMLSRRISVARGFVFTLGAGFLGGGLSVVIMALVALMVMVGSAQWELLRTGLENAALLPLLIFPEAFLNGTMVTALVVFQPNWVRLFEEPE